MITKLEQMFEALNNKAKKKLVAAWANDSHTIQAVSMAIDKGLIEGVLVGDKDVIKETCDHEGIDINKFEIVHASTDVEAAAKSVEMVATGKGDVLMKGLLSTDKYMRAILNKEFGLLPPKGILSHVTVIENPKYHKLLVVGDVAVIPQPDLKQKIAITNYLVHAARSLGIEKPKVAVIAASEQVMPGLSASADATILSKMADRGQIKGAFVEGPLALDLAVDEESAKVKKIESEVAGDADCLLFPNIEAGNVFYKTSTKLSDSELGAVVAGAKVPAVLSSRGDSTQTKLYSIALAALMAN
ncbi:MAG: bifunctional enoyl-CoA hydratase/phosphate acetyltransferase [Salinivirgaceae bacterium]|jgi:phosphotransacetylase|nr:bifunctional enoyl-CoA hydratase/phosphate acetyltransferase [Salinivirgaceae bacterium]